MDDPIVVTHAIRNDLQVIATLADVLQRRAESEWTIAQYEAIIEAVQRIARAVEALAQ